MKDIKLRIRSVESTMQITKAMELVASSKLRKAKANFEASQPYFNSILKTLSDIVSHNIDFKSVYITGNKNATDKKLYILMAGDRGLAGGYNNNMFKLFANSSKGENVCVIPIGKKALEYSKRRGYEIVTEDFYLVEDVSIGDCNLIAHTVSKMFADGEINSVMLGYTEFVSMLSQEPKVINVLPMTNIMVETKEEDKRVVAPVFEPSGDELFNMLTPQYISALVYGGLTSSWASELGARRTAMDAASKNAAEMVDKLSLVYNRARQAAITQEITEIVSGAGALE